MMMQLDAAVYTIFMVVCTHAASDSSYAPVPTSGEPYPASGAAATDSGTLSASAAPYPPSGWKPSGRLLVLPVKAASASTKKSWTAVKTTTESEFATEDTLATSPKPEPESENINVAANTQLQIPFVAESGIYYVLLPDGRLQKVTYSTMPLVQTVVPAKIQNNAAENEVPNGFQANVKYQDVEPIRGPIYSYSAAPLIRIFK